MESCELKPENVTGFIPHTSTHTIHPSSAYPYQSRGGAGVGAYPSYHRSDGSWEALLVFLLQQLVIKLLLLN